MAFGLEYEDEMEDWLKPGHLAVRIHRGGHRLLTTTRLCKMLYLLLLESGLREEEFAELVHGAASERGIGEEAAFTKIVLSLARDRDVKIPRDTLHLARTNYALR